MNVEYEIEQLKEKQGGSCLAMIFGVLLVLFITHSLCKFTDDYLTLKARVKNLEAAASK